MIEHKCVNCGAVLKFRKSTGIYKCPNCGSEFSDENIQRPEVTFLNAGEKFIELEEYDKAFEAFENACKLAPDNSACWLGMAKAETLDFSLLLDKDAKKIEKYMKNALDNASEDEKKSFSSDLERYNELLADFNKKENEIKKLDTFGTVLRGVVIAALVVLLVIKISIISGSQTGFFWKFVGVAISLAIDVVIVYVLGIILKNVQPKKVWQYVLFVIILTIIIAVIFAVDIEIAKQI